MKIEANDFTGVPIHSETTLDYPTAWAIQNEVGETLQHHHRCSSVPGWSPISGPELLCDCGAVEAEWKRRQEAVQAECEKNVRVAESEAHAKAPEDIAQS